VVQFLGVTSIIQTLIEREVRTKMKMHGISSLLIYPEQRESSRPATNKIIDVFEPVSTYSVIENEQVVEEFKDELTNTHKTILEYLDKPEIDFWCSH